jgi:hypothetical protein
MSTNELRIIVIVCYYGPFPWYFSYFLHSCKFNRSIDFLIVTDTCYEENIPPNVSFQKMTFGELKRRASDHLGFEVNISSPYKICEFKPAYGVIFSDFIQGYDFWGQSDLDLIYGNVRGFLTDEVLTKYDFISMRHDYTTGCFTLHRNRPDINYAFTRSKDYKTAFSHHEYQGFDEFNFRHTLLHDADNVEDVPTLIETFTHVMRSAGIQKDIKSLFDFMLIDGLPGKLRFDKGRILYKNQFEAILYHLHWLKKKYRPSAVPKQIPDTFFISPTRIYFK